MRRRLRPHDRLLQADALALAARGIDRLIANGGRMRLIVGCTLDEDEVRAIEQGYDLRAIVEVEPRARSRSNRPTWTPRDGPGRPGLAGRAGEARRQGRRPDRRPTGGPCPATGLYHEKVGIITDREGNRLSFSGSINETRGGWVNNRESFHVFGSWHGEYAAVARRRRRRACSSGSGTTRSRRVKVFDFPEAARKKLLEFQPTDRS